MAAVMHPNTSDHTRRLSRRERLLALMELSRLNHLSLVDDLVKFVNEEISYELRRIADHLQSDPTLLTPDLLRDWARMTTILWRKCPTCEQVHDTQDGCDGTS